MNRRPFLLLIFLLCVALPSFSLWKTLKTEAFTVFYPDGREQQAVDILEVLEYYRGYTKDLVGGEPRRVAVVLEDVGVQSNGLTDESREAYRNQYSHLTCSTLDGYANAARRTLGGYANTARSILDRYSHAGKPARNGYTAPPSHADKSARNRYTGSPHSHAHASSS